MYLLNGNRQHEIDISDRGFQYGDGLFETIEIMDKTPIFLSEHLDRLICGCKRLGIPAPEPDTITFEITQLVEALSDSSRAVLKIIISRGIGGRGYRQPEKIIPTRILSIHPFPEYETDYAYHGINLRSCSATLGQNPLLAGIKHNNRLEQVLARGEWNSQGFQEGLMCDFEGHVIEGTMSNVFFIKNGFLYTPLLDQCGVAGIIRALIIKLARQNSFPVVEKRIRLNDILGADELFVTNSIIGIWPVKRFDQQCFDLGPVTREIQNLFNATKRQQFDDN